MLFATPFRSPPDSMYIIYFNRNQLYSKRGFHSEFLFARDVAQ